MAQGEVGEIAALGPSVHLGYHANAAANDEAFTADGWFRTGDLGRVVDAAGNVEIVGRRKEIINRGGKKFFPREVEEVLYTHPKVMHAAMVGVADQRLGERNCLCVIPKAGQSVTLAEMIAHLKGQVADYKLPEEMHIVEELPFTATGKLQQARAHRLDRQGAGGGRTQPSASNLELCFSPPAARRGMRRGVRDWLRPPRGAVSLRSSSRVRKCGTFRERKTQ